MKQLRIARLKLENFKGIRELELQLDGNNAVISGENGTGKTTIADAYTWALTGKMSNGRTAEIGCYDAGGKVAGGVTHAVEVTFLKGKTFRREMNGSSIFYVDGIPMKMNEYREAVAAATNGAIGVLTTPETFCEMGWQERRTILMELAKISDSEVLASSPELAPLSELLATFSLEQLLLLAKDRRKKLKAELATIPARIDELTRQAPTGDKAAITAKLAELQETLRAKKSEVSSLQAISQKALEPFNEIDRLRQSLYELKDAALKTENQIEQSAKALSDLRKEFALQAKARSGKCPMCGAKVASARLATIQANLKKIAESGKKLAQKYELQKQSLASENSKINELEETLARKQEQFDNDLSHEQVSANLLSAINERDSILEAINSLERQLLEFEGAEKAAARIAELTAQEQDLSRELAEFERQIYLAEQFSREKIRLIEGTINAKFQFVQWKMYREFKVAEGASECCEPMINGVPYGGALSKGERLKAALDILRTVQQIYQVELPVFVDDAESFTSNTKIAIPNQIIRLKATEGSPLKVDVEKSPAQISLF